MRVLGVTETCDLASMYLRLQDEGHEVRVAVAHPLAQGTLAGMVPRSADWRVDLDWVREAGPDGFVLFEAIGFGGEQDALRRDGFRVIGGSAFGDRLESDRALAQCLLGELGLNVAATHEFTDCAAARQFIAANPRRYVLKYSGRGNGRNYVGLVPDGSDVDALLAANAADSGDAGAFILMDHVSGIEMGVGAFFNGVDFLTPACLDWEHKRFFAGDMGELTGEMGTVATFSGTDAFFAATLARAAPLLRGHGHVGWVNLNTIVNDDGIWPLEFTCRFGYPGYSVLEPLQAVEWGALFAQLSSASSICLATRPGFSVGVVLTTPPFPYSREQVDEPVGLPITLGEVDPRHLHWGEVGLSGGRLATSGQYGWTAVVTGTGAAIAEARDAAYARAGQVGIPNMRYRLDIGDKLIAGELDRLRAMGLVG